MDIFGINKRAEKRAELIVQQRMREHRVEVAKHRAFAASQLSNLLNSWVTESRKLDADLKSGLKKLRARSRDASQNNDYGRKYLQLVRTNVVGPHGIRLQVRSKNNNGQLDEQANRLVEEAWARWGKRGNCDVTGKLSFADVQSLFIETAARDGEVLIHIVRNAGNPFRFALQFLDVDLLDENYNIELKNGYCVRMGIEFDPYGKPTAYHITQLSPGQDTYYGGGQHRLRIPAKDIIHCFRQERPHQSRGYPWTAAALVELHHLGAFQEAAIVASRLGASNMGFFTETDPSGGYGGDNTDSTGNLISEVEAGQFIKLPRGVDFKEFKPGYPDQFYDDFVKRSLKSIASGFQVSYTSLASDPEGTNFSSMRGEVMAERDNWKSIQGWMISDFLERLYPEWLDAALLTRQVPLPYSRFDKLNTTHWQPRGWGWVDPVKDVTALVMAMKNNLKSHSRATAEQGIDFDDEIAQIASDKEKMKQLGLLTEEDEKTAKRTTENQGAEPVDADVAKDIKATFDAYGIGVRAGALTPQGEDEDHFRAIAKLPPKSEAAKQAWVEDGGVRRPITLKAGDAFEAEQQSIVDEDQPKDEI